MRYSCIVLDHDDTAVDSTPYLHYPAHIEVMKELRPGVEPISLHGWMLKNFSPGIMEYMQQELYFTAEEITREYEIWQDYVDTHTSPFFPGFLDMLRDFHNAGGIITVVSHSTIDQIRKDYRSAGAEELIQAVYGWDFDAEKRKPSPFPVHSIMKQFNLKPEEILVIDDLKPAVTMAESAGVGIAGAGWGIQVEEIRDYMQKHCTYYFSDIAELHSFLMKSGD